MVCLLVLLFPVVSATDDLQATRVAFEEITSAKKISKTSPGTKSGFHHASAYLTASSDSKSMCERVCNFQFWVIVQLRFAIIPDALVGRAPPVTRKFA
jgi:hypothetical protein